MIAFVATWIGFNVWTSRRDTLSQASFELKPPAGFTEEDKGAAAMIIADDDAKEAKNAVKHGGQIFFHFEENSPPELEYGEVVEVKEDTYPLRPDEETRAALYGGGTLKMGDVVVKVVDSRVGKYGKNEAIAARLEADALGKKIRFFQYVLPTDRGRAVVHASCLVVEEGKYRPIYDEMIANARGVAYRPTRLPWPAIAGISAAVGIAAFLVAWRLKQPVQLPPKRRDEDEEADAS
jgi:hypothetical protein